MKLSTCAHAVLDAVWRRDAADLKFVEPTENERNCDGADLVGRAVYLEEYGPGRIQSFNKTLFWGASTHTIAFADNRDTEGASVTTRELKLERKSNTDPEKLPWLVQASSVF